MKLLSFADLHGDVKLLKKLVKKAKGEEIDLVVAAGDLTNFEDKLRYILRKLNGIGKKVLVIPGNHESDKSLKEVIEDYSNCVDIHEKVVKIGDYVFLGYGEGGFSLEDADFRKIARKWYGEYQKKKLVLVTHAPPFGTRLDKINDDHVGNKDIRKFIERIKPKLVVCGHLHENAGKIDKIGETKVVNPGWEGAVIELS